MTKIRMNGQILTVAKSRLSYGEIIALSGNPQDGAYSVLHKFGCCVESVKCDSIVDVNNGSELEVYRKQN